MSTISERRLLYAIVAVLIVFQGWNFVVAQSAQISMCAEKDGDVYMIGPKFENKKCKRGDTLLTWNTVGPQGLQGPQGPKGDQGLIGTQGPKGVDGVDGANGTDGKDGEDGEDGVSIPCLKIEGNNVIFEGCNVIVRSGSGSTNGAVNGLGNLVIGYDENDSSDSKTGSHNLIIGQGHSYTSFGGLIAGFNNKVTGENSTVSGGHQNLAEGKGSWVGGGEDNWSTGDFASVSGGAGGVASGNYGSILGGNGNNIGIEASYSTISGGHSNFVGGDHASLLGGEDNVSNGEFSAVGGGKDRMTTKQHEWVAGSLGKGGSNIAFTFGDFLLKTDGSVWGAGFLGNVFTLVDGVNFSGVTNIPVQISEIEDWQYNRVVDKNGDFWFISLSNIQGGWQNLGKLP